MRKKELIEKVESLTEQATVMQSYIEYFKFIDKYKCGYTVSLETYSDIDLYRISIVFNYAKNQRVKKLHIVDTDYSSYLECRCDCSNSNISVKCVDKKNKKYRIKVWDEYFLVDCRNDTVRKLYPGDVQYMN